MFRSALAAALRHLYRGKLYATIAVSGLAMGLCAVLLAALYIRSQYSHEHYVAGYQDIYLVTVTGSYPGRADWHVTQTPLELAGLITQRFPQAIAATRIIPGDVLLRLGDIEESSSLLEVDPNFFDTVPLRVVAGDPVAALAQPDRLVITRGIARKLFGDKSPLGGAVEILSRSDSRSHLLTVGAVIEDLPEDRSYLAAGVIVSGKAAWTGFSISERMATSFRQPMSQQVHTLVRLHAGESPDSMRDGLAEMLPQLAAEDSASPTRYRLEPVRIDRMHTDPRFTPAGFTGRIVMMAMLALVILTVAAVNFVNLLTARSGMRALEVGVRKLAGAPRTTLALQFLGEAFVHVVLAVLVAVALTELLLPRLNAFLDVNARFEYWKDPVFLGWVLPGTIGFALLAGFWPALVLSALRPLGAMHGTRLVRGRGGLFRQLLVSLQFALLTGLILAAGVVYLQRHYATEQALRFDTDQVLVVEMRCTPARMVELRNLAGLRDAACSGSQLLGGDGATNGLEVRTRDGRSITMGGVWIDDRTLDLYGVKPLAGRTLAAADFGHGFFGRHSTGFLINESAMQALGFDSPAAAIGPYPLMRDTAALNNGRPAGNGLDEIIGVLPDFSMATVDTRIGPTVFFADPMQFSTISLKLKAAEISTTLAAIDRVWKNTGGWSDGYSRDIGHLSRYFYDERVERMYQSMLREASAFGIAALVAVALALLGLLGLAASVAEQRTKEIGIRKALGASTGDVLRLLLWQFSKPMLWANLIAWPMAGWAMQRWLSGFAYHIDLPLWLFPATTLATVLIALATIIAHAVRVARSKPVMALRHE